MKVFNALSKAYLSQL